MKLERTEQVKPSERQEFAVLCLLQRLGEAWETDSEAYHFAAFIVVSHDGDEIEISESDIVLDEVIDLLIIEMRESIEVFVTFIEYLEESLSIAFLEQLVARHLASMEVIALFYHASHLEHLLRNGVRHWHGEHHPVVVLGKLAHLLHVFRVVSVVMVSVHRGESVESLDQHSLAIHVGKAHRADDIVHTMLASVVFYGVEERL